MTGAADRFFLRLHGINPDTGLEGSAKTPNAYNDTAGDDDAFRFYLRTKGIDPDTGMLKPEWLKAALRIKDAKHGSGHSRTIYPIDAG